jgi:hypothetical protein
MSAPLFTPGPWWPGHFVDDTIACDCHSILSEGYAGAVAVMCIGNGLPISDGGNDAPPLQEAKANARLIAAAPDLYVVADHPVLEWLCTDGLESIPEPQRTSVRIFLVPARAAALAKARGEVAP